MSKAEVKNIKAGKGRIVSKYFWRIQEIAKKLKLIKGNNIYKNDKERSER